MDKKDGARASENVPLPEDREEPPGGESRRETVTESELERTPGRRCRRVGEWGVVCGRDGRDREKQKGRGDIGTLDGERESEKWDVCVRVRAGRRVLVGRLGRLPDALWRATEGLRLHPSKGLDTCIHFQRQPALTPLCWTLKRPSV